MARLRVSVGDRSVDVGPEESLTFGRSPDCGLCLDEADLSISRRAGALEYENNTWWLTNRSTARPLSVVDDVGFRSVLAPGRRTAVESPIRVMVDATGGTHTLLVEVEARDRPAETGEPPSGQSTAIGESVMISPADRRAMVALFAGYLEDPPRYDPNPKTYAAAASRLGWPRTTLVKRIEYLRSRLAEAGVPNMNGWNALTNLAEYALSRRLITKEDLRLIRR
jgi:hypothetical protein